MNLLIASSEAIPYAKTGGLADVTGALPQELSKLGHDVILILPRYRSLDHSGRRFRPVARLSVAALQGSPEAVIEEDLLQLPDQERSIRVWAVRQDAFFDRADLYQENGRDYPDNLERFAWFSRSVVEVAAFLHRERNWPTDILHLHDWQTALCSVFLKTTDHDRPELKRVKSVLTLHNVGYQGIFPGSRFHATGLPSSLFTIEGLEFYGSVNVLKGGIIYADHLTTVSPSYAKEIMTPQFGFGLEGVLRSREKQLTGIINGIDTGRWNPASDPFLPGHYSRDDRRGKRVCKQKLQEELGLPQKDGPLLAVIARLTSQKGIDLLEAVIPQLMQRDLDLQFAILGAGDPAHEGTLRQLRTRFPKQIGLHIGFDERLAHRIEGGADMFLMPSRYEPCGLSQLYSLRYGTVPIVSKTGGLIDTVVPANTDTMRSGTATGFHIEFLTEEGLVRAVERAVQVYTAPDLWDQLIYTGMGTDVSWSHSAKIYDALFADVARGN